VSTKRTKPGAQPDDAETFWTDKAPRPGLMKPRATRGGAVQAKLAGGERGSAPRPELMPASMGGGAAQAKKTSTAPSSASWPGAPRPELLPGLDTRRGASGRTAQLFSRADKRLTDSPPLTREEHTQLQRVARDFVQGYGTHPAMTPAQRTAFGTMTAPARRAWMRGGAVPPPAPGFRVGDVVERVGAIPLAQEMTRKYGKKARVLESVKLRFLDAIGGLHNDLCELDGLVLNPKGKVVCLVSAKLNPGAVHPATDRDFLDRFYTWPAARVPRQEKNYRKQLVSLLKGNPNETYMNTNNIVGLAIEYEESGQTSHKTLAQWTQDHALATSNASAVPVIGLTPKPTNADQARSNLARGDVQLGPSTDDLLDMLGAEMAKLI